MIRLSLMMFLQFFVWGSWYVTGPTYLEKIGFGAETFGWMYAVGPIAGMLSPFFVGMIADRFLPSQIVLGILHLLGTAGMYGAVHMMQVEVPDPSVINGFFFAHMLCYYPSLALVNSVAMSNLTDTDRQFPVVRVFGTIGWIAAGLVVSQLKVDAAIDQFYLTIGASGLLGVFAFALPNTPPPGRGKAFSIREAFGVDALALLRERSFAVFMLGSFLTCIPLAFYYQIAARFVTASGIEDTGRTMSYGQMSEIFFMLLLPVFLNTFGVKRTLVVGMLAWIARYSLFALGADEGVVSMLITGIVLHGVCYDFFFVTGQIYTNRCAPAAIRSQAQGMLVLFTLGLGMFIGAKVAGWIEAAHTTGPAEAPVVDWEGLWWWPAGMAAVVLVVFLIAFRDRGRASASEAS